MLFRSTKFVKNHSFQLELFSHYTRQVPTKVITSIIAHKFQDNGHIIRPRDMVGEMQMHHGIEILYNKTWRAKKYAQNLVYGDPLHYFQLLPFYFYMLEREYLGIVTKLKVNDENMLEYLFLALCLCINGFVSCCKPIIMINGTHLKEKFRGVMFVTVAMDGNEQIYPIAFGFGYGKNDRSWN